jgi:nicotinate-nucleotide pyrophosphorylase (carboxylating)
MRTRTHIATPAIADTSVPNADALIALALAEDLDGDSDITSQSIVPADLMAKATLVVKHSGVLAGLPIFARVFELVDASTNINLIAKEGSRVTSLPYVAAEINGKARSLLLAERTALNIIQRLSGIATVTDRYASLAAQKNIAILDTRKTTPGLRALEKYAVRVGGGVNHRYGLFDAILIKDNHVSVAGSVAEAIRRSRQIQPAKPVQVEVTDIPQLHEAISAGAEKIMLDNMTPAMVAKAVAIIRGADLRHNNQNKSSKRETFIEVSGGINLDTLPDYLIEGVNAISVGALTHSVKSLDISLEIEV